MLHGMWDLPGPGIEPMSPALAGGFLTTEPPEKSLAYIFNDVSFHSQKYPGLSENSHGSLILT